MKISELIKKLDFIKSSFGDLEVFQYSEKSNVVTVQDVILDYCGFDYVFLEPSNNSLMSFAFNKEQEENENI